MNTSTDHTVKKYLKQLDAELADLPRGRRDEIVEEIAEHIAEAQAQRPTESEAETRSLLERLGDPADIAADARQRFGVVPAQPGWQETAALVFLLVGGFLFFFGWFVGLVLLWSSSVWTARDKLVGTLIVPGGLATAVFVFTLWAANTNSSGGPCSTDPNTSRIVETCTSGGSTSWLALFGLALLFVAPLVTTAYLALEMRRAREVATV